MIKNAKLYEDKLRVKMREARHDLKNRYFFSPNDNSDFNFNSNGGRLHHHAFVSTKDDEVIGYISYWFDSKQKIAGWFEAINFSDDKMIFGRDLRIVVSDIFIKFGMKTLEFVVICGNPIEKTYDRVVEKLGGRILGKYEKVDTDMLGNICDDKRYEITREGFMNSAGNGYINKRGEKGEGREI